MNRLCTALLLLLVATTANAQPDADIIVTGSAVLTMDPDRPSARAVALREGRIVYVGTRDGAFALRGASTRWIDAGDGIVLPGLVDAHGHLRNLGPNAGRTRVTTH